MLGRILMAPFLILGGIILLIWNEDRAVDREYDLITAQKQVVSTTLKRIDHNTSMNNTLIHLTHQVSIDQSPQDPEFNITIDGLILKRTVSTYQEHKDKNNHVSYNWSSSPNSSTFFAQNVKMGNIAIGSALIETINTNLRVDLESIKKVWPSNYTLSNNHLYSGNPSDPKVGDQRVSFYYAPKGTYSVIAKLSEQGLYPYQETYGSIAMMELGSLDAPSMIAQAKENNVTLTWILRGVGLFFIFFGFASLFSLGGLLTMIPILNFITGPLIGVISFILSLIISAFVIGLSWLVVRPIIGLSVLGLGVTGIAILVYLKKKKGTFST